jgi:uncharacterized protein (UPF0218 family)
MPKTYFLPEKSRSLLQKPWGKLLAGDTAQVASKYSKLLVQNKYPLIITVGDYCSHHLKSDIKIFDNKVQRRDFVSSHAFCLTVDNPAGTIQEQAWDAVKQAVEKPCNIRVNGEEDLLVIPAVLEAKTNTLVIYGLPNQGICCIKVTPAIKKTFRDFLKTSLTLEKR